MANLSTAIDALIEKIKADYASWGNTGAPITDHRAQMIQEFNDGISYTVGKKYAKIVREGGGVWGFVVIAHDDKKFAYGDILKPAGWATPARNFARGNVFDDKVAARWTSAT